MYNNFSNTHIYLICTSLEFIIINTNKLLFKTKIKEKNMKKLASFLTFLLLIEHCTSSTLFKRQQPQVHTTNKETDYKIVCYYTNWAQYRNDPAKFFPENIDPTLCTHIIFSFAKIDENLELSSFEVKFNSISLIKFFLLSLF